MRLSYRPDLGPSAAVCAIAVVSLLLGACAQSRTPGPSWNLTGGGDRAPLPSRPIHAEPPRQAALPPQHQSPAPPRYIGGRDPITGRAPTFGTPPHGLQSAPPLPPPGPQSQPQGLPTSPPAAVPHSGPQPRASRVEVRPGQTLAMIAAEQRVSLTALMIANNLRDPYLIPGQVLVIPR